MIKTIKSLGFYVLCYSERDYLEKKGETKKIGPFKNVENAWARKQDEERSGDWFRVEMVEKTIVTDY